eukprot:gene1828-462_t
MAMHDEEAMMFSKTQRPMDWHTPLSHGNALTDVVDVRVTYPLEPARPADRRNPIVPDNRAVVPDRPNFLPPMPVKSVNGPGSSGITRLQLYHPACAKSLTPAAEPLCVHPRLVIIPYIPEHYIRFAGLLPGHAFGLAQINDPPPCSTTTQAARDQLERELGQDPSGSSHSMRHHDHAQSSLAAAVALHQKQEMQFQSTIIEATQQALWTSTHTTSMPQPRITHHFHSSAPFSQSSSGSPYVQRANAVHAGFGLTPAAPLPDFSGSSSSGSPNPCSVFQLCLALSSLQCPCWHQFLQLLVDHSGFLPPIASGQVSGPSQHWGTGNSQHWVDAVTPVPSHVSSHLGSMEHSDRIQVECAWAAESGNLGSVACALVEASRRQQVIIEWMVLFDQGAKSLGLLMLHEAGYMDLADKQEQAREVLVRAQKALILAHQSPVLGAALSFEELIMASYDLNESEGPHDALALLQPQACSLSAAAGQPGAACDLEAPLSSSPPSTPPEPATTSCGIVQAGTVLGTPEARMNPKPVQAPDGQQACKSGPPALIVPDSDLNSDAQKLQDAFRTIAQHYGNAQVVIQYPQNTSPKTQPHRNSPVSPRSLLRTDSTSKSKEPDVPPVSPRSSLKGGPVARKVSGDQTSDIGPDDSPQSLSRRESRVQFKGKLGPILPTDEDQASPLFPSGHGSMRGRPVDPTPSPSSRLPELDVSANSSIVNELAVDVAPNSPGAPAAFITEVFRANESGGILTKKMSVGPAAFPWASGPGGWFDTSKIPERTESEIMNDYQADSFTEEYLGPLGEDTSGDQNMAMMSAGNAHDDAKEEEEEEEYEDNEPETCFSEYELGLIRGSWESLLEAQGGLEATVTAWVGRLMKAPKTKASVTLQQVIDNLSSDDQLVPIFTELMQYCPLIKQPALQSAWGCFEAILRTTLPPQSYNKLVQSAWVVAWNQIEASVNRCLQSLSNSDHNEESTGSVRQPPPPLPGVRDYASPHEEVQESGTVTPKLADLFKDDPNQQIATSEQTAATTSVIQDSETLSLTGDQDIQVNGDAGTVLPSLTDDSTQAGNGQTLGDSLATNKYVLWVQQGCLLTNIIQQAGDTLNCTALESGDLFTSVQDEVRGLSNEPPPKSWLEWLLEGYAKFIVEGPLFQDLFDEADAELAAEAKADQEFSRFMSVGYLQQSPATNASAKRKSTVASQAMVAMSELNNLQASLAHDARLVPEFELIPASPLLSTGPNCSHLLRKTIQPSSLVLLASTLDAPEEAEGLLSLITTESPHATKRGDGSQ